MNLTYAILGTLEIRDGQRVVPLAAAKQRILLACLLLRAGKQASLTELYDALWADDPPASPRAAVHNYVGRLRKKLNDEVIETTPNGYRLVVDPGQIDLLRFRRLVSQAGQSRRNGDLVEESRALGEALGLWRGPALADICSDWLEQYEIPGLTEERLSALERRIAVDLELGRHADLVTELRVLTSECPLRERFWSQLILALYRDERSAEALSAYHQARAVLSEETGLDPGPELQRLYQGILDADPGLAAPQPQPQPPRAAVVAGPAPSRPRPPAQLPPDVGDFAGRATLKAHLTSLLVPPSPPKTAPLVLLSGPPGVGKTALATHTAHHVRSRFPDGQLHVNLRGYALDSPLTPTEVLARFLRALGAPPESVPIDLDEQAALYRSLLSGSRVLIVLDNANSPDQVRPLLPAEPGCAVLVTSRDNLQGLTALQSARRLRIDVLEEPAALELLAAIIDDDRPRNEPVAARELARLCGHLPLALRIAAANLASNPHLAISDYVTGLDTDNRLQELIIDDDPQAAVYVTFEHSHAALAPDIQRGFRYLALVPGGDFGAHAAAALLESTPEEARHVLESLATVNLLLNDRPGRYHFHDLIRLYATQLGKSMDEQRHQDAARQRVFDFYTHSTAAASKVIEPHRPEPILPASQTSVRLPDFADRQAATTWMEEEGANLQAAVINAADIGPYPATWHLSDAMTAPLALTERFTEWMTVAKAGLQAALHVGNRRGEGIMRLSLGHAYLTAGHQELGIEQLEQASAIYQLMQNLPYQAVCQNALGMASLWLGRVKAANHHFVETRSLAAKIESSYYVFSALHGLGIAHRYLGQLDHAVELLCEAIEIGRDTNPYGFAMVQFDLGCAHRDQGQLEFAKDRLGNALTLFRDLPSRFGETRTLIGLALTHLAGGHVDLALELAENAWNFSQGINHRRTEAEAWNALGACRQHLSRFEQARVSHQQAFEVASKMHYLNGKIEALLGLSGDYRGLGRHAEARACAEQALSLVSDTEFRLHAGAALMSLARLDWAAGDVDGASARCANALLAFRTTGQRLEEEQALLLVDELERARGG